MNRATYLTDLLRDVIADASGQDMRNADIDQDFLAMGLDSLVLTQVSLAIRKKFKTKIPFRRLLEELDSLNKVANYLDENLAAGTFAPPAPTTPDPVMATMTGTGSTGRHDRLRRLLR